MFRKILFLALICAVTCGTFSCKSKKKLAEKEAAEAKARKIAKAKADLEEILMDDGDMSVNEMENIIQAVKDANIDDPEVQQLLSKAEEKLRKRKAEEEARKRAEQLAKEREERLKRESETRETKSLVDYFQDIANAPTTATANANINQALSLFSSDDVPVLIVIGTYGGEKDYDRPTTISKYLNYLKDQKKNTNKILNVEYDSNGKIKLLELEKK